MFAYDYIIAAVLLTSPVEGDLVSHLERVQPSILQWAVAIEILDPREDQFFQGMSKDPVGDLQALRKRRADLVRTAPQIAECDRFPQRKQIDEFLDDNRAYRKQLVARLEIDPIHADQLQSAISEVDQLHHVWSVVRDCRTTFYYVPFRRQSLQSLRELIGDEAFYRGELPPHVPYWHIPKLR